MKNLAAVLALGMLLQAAPISNAQAIAVVHAKAYVVPGSPPITNATIIIQAGRIVTVAAGVTPAAGTHIIDAQGKIVTSGLMNSGTELGLVESGPADTTDHAVSTGSLGPAFDIQYALNANSTLLPLARADGLTRAVTFPSTSGVPPFAGLGAVLRLSEGADILDRPQAAVFATIGGMASSQVGGSRSAQWILIRNMLDEARRYGASHREAPEETHARDRLLDRANLVALLPVVQGKIPFAITAHRESDIRQAIKLADDYKVRVILCGAGEAWRAADALAAHKIPVVLNPFDSTPVSFDQIGARLDNAAILQRAGVTISFSVPGVHMSHDAGFVIREGAGIAVANGLPWEQALKSLTVNPAETWGIADHYGTLEPGKDADLVIWSGDPLEPMSAPEVVLVRGKQVSLKTRQTELQERYSPRHKNDPWPPGYR